MRYDNKWFIDSSIEIHGDKYDYSLVNYINLRTKVIIICKEHGKFEQTPDKHFIKRGCPNCGGTKKLTLSNFIKRAKEKHNNYYDYSLVEYKNSQNKIKILCPKHGEFEQLPSVHLNGCGCIKCSININNFIENANNVHHNKYDYSLTKYKNSYTKVDIICPKHGKFEQFPQSHIDVGCVLCKREENFIRSSKKTHNNKYDYYLVDYKDKYTKVKIVCPKHGMFEQEVIYHIRGSGCKKCSDDIKKLNTDIFIEKAKKIHGNKYDYSLVEYINTFDKVKIICQIHGEFNLAPNDHINGTKRGCSICGESFGEKQIAKFLKENDIIFNRQQKFDKCVNILKLSFDFYLPKYNCCIEYDGIQHFIPIKYFGGDKKLKNTKINDDIKTNFCTENQIKLIRIKYDEDILQKLKKELYKN
jgi:hypothetical protein